MPAIRGKRCPSTAARTSLLRANGFVGLSIPKYRRSRPCPRSGKALPFDSRPYLAAQGERFKRAVHASPRTVYRLYAYIP